MKRSARIDICSYVCYAPRSDPEVQIRMLCPRFSTHVEAARLGLPKGFLAQTPKNQPPVFVAQDRQNQQQTCYGRRYTPREGL